MYIDREQKKDRERDIRDKRFKEKQGVRFEGVR